MSSYWSRKHHCRSPGDNSEYSPGAVEPTNGQGDFPLHTQFPNIPFSSLASLHLADAKGSCARENPRENPEHAALSSSRMGAALQVCISKTRDHPAHHPLDLTVPAMPPHGPFAVPRPFAVTWTTKIRTHPSSLALICKFL